MMLQLDLLRYFTLFEILLFPFASACDFPDFAQDNVTSRQWRGRITGQNTKSSLVLNFKRNILTMTSSIASVTSCSKVCVKALAGHRYLVAHEEKGQEGAKYNCIQLIQRGPHILQLKQSAISRRMKQSLCEDLKMDPWLIVDVAHIGQQVEPCPLRGGFSIRVLDARSAKARCDTLSGETRLESECMPSDGMVFYFRAIRCLPQRLYMYPTQTIRCLASWTDGNHHHFTLLKHSSLQYLWLLRHLGDQHDSFTSYLLDDLVADTERQVVLTHDYLRIDMVRDTPRPLTSLCADEYEGCTVYSKPCELGPEMVMSCPRTCNVCNATRPRQCRFANELQGTWYEQGVRRPALTVTPSELSVHRYYRFHCIDWKPPQEIKTPSFSQMLATTFTNGCRPRYTCVLFRKGSASVLFFKLSQSRVWPLTAKPDDVIDCSSFTFSRDEASNIPYNSKAPGSKFHSRHFRPLFSRRDDVTAATTTCDITQQQNGGEMKITFRDDSHCLAKLLQPDSRDRIMINLTNPCPFEAASDFVTNYRCVESSILHPSGDRLIITASGGGKKAGIHTAYYCWFLPKRPKNKFYLVKSAHCNEVTKRRIKKNRLKPLATFRIKVAKIADHIGTTLPSTPAMSIEKEQGKILGRRGGIDDVTQQPSQRNLEDDDLSYTVVDEVNVTPPTQTDDSVAKVAANPFVIAGAVIILAAIQIPCLCKASS